MWILSGDNVTIERREEDLPAKHWEVTGPEQGRYHDLTSSNAADFGWSELVETPAPDDDHMKTIEHDGTGWVEVWAYDEVLGQANVIDAAVMVEREAIYNMVDALTEIVEAESLTEAEQTEALKKLARICRLAVEMI